jgi:hypothetical protein
MVENNLTFLEAKQRLENPSFATVTKTQTLTPFLNSEPPSGLNELFPPLPTRKAKPSLTQNTSSRNIQHNHPFNPTKIILNLSRRVQVGRISRDNRLPITHSRLVK